MSTWHNNKTVRPENGVYRDLFCLVNDNLRRVETGSDGIPYLGASPEALVDCANECGMNLTISEDKRSSYFIGSMAFTCGEVSQVANFSINNYHAGDYEKILKELGV